MKFVIGYVVLFVMAIMAIIAKRPAEAYIAGLVILAVLGPSEKK